MIVDDEKINIDYIVKNFKDNFKFKATTNSSAVFEILENNKIDLILLDIQMPIINGFELAKKIKESEEFKNIPFIFLTSQTDTKSIVDGFELGAIDYIGKPFNLSELKARINTHSKNFFLQQKIKEQQKEILEQSKFAVVGEMTTMLAHQWRQPLNVISLLVQELDLDRKMNIFTDEEYKEKKSLLMKILFDLSSTIENFAKYFNENSFQGSSNIIDSINEAKEIFKESLDENNITLSILLKNAKKSDFELKISSKDLLQIFLSIIQNSIEAIERLSNKNNKNFIKVELYKNSDFIEIKIFDNGFGIDPNIKDSIFEPYVTSKEDLNGPGLGLYTTKMIIDNYLKGTIKGFNTENGTCFAIKIKNGMDFNND